MQFNNKKKMKNYSELVALVDCRPNPKLKFVDEVIFIFFQLVTGPTDFKASCWTEREVSLDSCHLDQHGGDFYPLWMKHKGGPATAR